MRTRRSIRPFSSHPAGRPTITGYCPEVGDVVDVNFDPQEGREQQGRRPALVLTPRDYNRRVELCVLCPITSQVKGYPFEVTIPQGYGVTGVVLADQVKSLSWVARNAVLRCTAPPEVVRETKGKIRALLQMP
jgi:mRNA interferase MazF